MVVWLSSRSGNLCVLWISNTLIPACFPYIIIYHQFPHISLEKCPQCFAKSKLISINCDDMNANDYICFDQEECFLIKHLHFERGLDCTIGFRQQGSKQNMVLSPCKLCPKCDK